jgi:hypothetical protein
MDCERKHMPFLRSKIERSGTGSGWLRWGILFCVLAGAWCPAQTSSNVMILQSYHPYGWTHAILQGINNVLGGEEDLSFFIEYMDAKRFNTPAHYQKFYELYPVLSG